MADKAPKHKDTIESIEDSLSKTELFIENNQKMLLGVLAGIIVLVGGVLAYRQFVAKPHEAEAQSALFRAEAYFSKDSFNLALNGNDSFEGFLSVADEYSGTDAGNLAHYYAGICYLNTGKFEEAIAELSDFSSDDVLISSMGEGAKGDAQMELGKTEEAIASYMRAAENRPNSFTSPMFFMKAAMAQESLGNYEKSIEIYKQIKTNYFQSNEGREIEKYIARAEGMLAAKK